MAAFRPRKDRPTRRAGGHEGQEPRGFLAQRVPDPALAGMGPGSLVRERHAEVGPEDLGLQRGGRGVDDVVEEERLREAEAGVECCGGGLRGRRVWPPARGGRLLGGEAARQLCFLEAVVDEGCAHGFWGKADSTRACGRMPALEAPQGKMAMKESWDLGINATMRGIALRALAAVKLRGRCHERCQKAAQASPGHRLGNTSTIV
ncbi:hypothetical protein UVI_02016330 [Ustilaginoidea virens]|uniref:Uncharacterized protein n=1 Tax=Ustilaginoidea virens TaxID=1159556 RepID=A0A1B5KRR0_USTVR|nr:hypothetical protein UVI_02016330 [Ustilaginoidea virens]